MHPEALDFVARVVYYADSLPLDSVIEFGSRNINGTVREVIPHNRFHGIDLYPGPDVDEVANAVRWRSEILADLVVCCEVLEHSPEMEGVVRSAYENLRPGGLFIMTCATDPREPHSAHDGGPLRDEHYANVDPQRFKALCVEQGFTMIVLEAHLDRGDLYALARK